MVITVIYDGNCQLCLNSVNWLEKKLTFNALNYQSAPLDQYGLTLTECEKQVYAIADLKKYAGISAVIFLLNARGNKVSAFILKVSGPIGAFGYKLIASNRQSLFVRGLSRFIKKITELAQAQVLALEVLVRLAAHAHALLPDLVHRSQPY